MRWLERLVGAARRVGTVAKRRAYYAGAQASRLLLDWIVSPLSADKELRADLLKLRTRARDLARNNPIIRQYLALLTANVVGPSGVKLQARVADAAGAQLVALNTRLEAGWAEWSASASACGRYTLTQLMQLAIRTLAVDGEAFIRLVRAPLNQYGFALQLIDADQVDHEYNRPAGPDGRGGRVNEIRLGVEVDEWSRPVAYHLWDRHLSDDNGSARERIRLPAAEVIHLYDPDRVNQTRGVTWLNSVMVPLKIYDGYVEAELVAARTASAKMGWLKYTDAAAMQLEGEIPDSPLQYDASPGTIEMLPPGVEFQEWSPSHPTTAYEAFAKSVLRQVASGLRVSYNALANDLQGVNYSSMRSGLLIERDMWRTWQQLVIDRVYRPVYAEWVRTALLTGALQLDPVNPARYLAARWIPRGWAWVDPLKDIQATVTAVQHGLASRTSALAETGADFEDVLTELAAEKQAADAAGLILGANPNVQASQQQPADEQSTTTQDA